MTRRLLLLVLLLIANRAIAETAPFEVRSQVTRQRREVRPEPPRPPDERRQASVVVRSARPSTPRDGDVAPSSIDVVTVLQTATSSWIRRIEADVVPRSSAAPAGPAPARAPPLA